MENAIDIKVGSRVVNIKTKDVGRVVRISKDKIGPSGKISVTIAKNNSALKTDLIENWRRLYA